MEIQSSTISVEQQSLSVVTNESFGEHRLNKLEKWHRVAKRVVQFFRLMKIAKLRARFTDILSHGVLDDLNGYQTTKIQEDLLFLDDVNRYREVSNTFLTCGFVWQDKEFRLGKLKANYIYDRYMSTAEAIAKTNIPPDTVLPVGNRMNSLKVFPSLTYSNLFNDAEKFIREKLLMIYMREGVNCFAVKTPQQLFASMMNRLKGSQTTSEATSPSAQQKKANTDEQSRSIRSKIKPKETFSTRSQYDEILLPNWTYSTTAGVVYNPVREKRLKASKRNGLKKTEDVHSNVHTPNTINFLQLPSPILSSDIPRHRKPADNDPTHFLAAPRSRSNQKAFAHRTPHRLALPQYNRCDTVFTKAAFDKRQLSSKLFICKVHSSSYRDADHLVLHQEAPYRMASKIRIESLFNKTSRLCQ